MSDRLPGGREAARAALRAILVAAAAIAGVPASFAADPSPLEVFQKFIQDRDPGLRRKAVQALAEERGAAVVEALLLAARDEDPQVADRATSILLDRRDRADEVAALTRALGAKSPTVTRVLAVRALAECARAGAAPMRAALSDRDPDVRIAAARGLAKIRDREAVPLLHEQLAAREPLARAAACEAIGDILGAEARGAASAVALGDSDPEPRIAAVRILGAWPSDDTVSHVVRCLRDEAWSLRVAATKSLAEYAVSTPAAREAAAALVQAIERESRTRVRVELGETLWKLTGTDFGPDPARWVRWFRDTGGRFDPPPKKLTRAVRDDGGTHGGLADLPIESEHVAFVFDASSSMNDPVRFGAKRTKRDDLRDAFEQVVAKLPKPSWMNLIPFATEPVPMKPALFEATPSARAAALRHLEKTPADGRTNLYDAVELALRDRDADTLVVLTDGAPSAGRRTGRTAILEGVAELNRYRLARIHTVEIGAANTGARWKGFLADLAEVGGGRHLAR